MTGRRLGRAPKGIPAPGSGPRGGGENNIPALARLALRVLLREEEREFFLGDLEESFRRPSADRARPPSWIREILGAASLRLPPNGHRSNRPHPHRPRKGDGMFREILSDLKYGARTMLRSPVFTVVALLTMALGIGANTAIFSLVHGVVIAPLPYPEPDRIVFLMENNLQRGWASFTVSPPNFWDWQERNRSTELLAAYQVNTVVYTGGDRPQSVTAYRASEDFLKILGGEPAQGRGLMEEDLDPDAEGVVILTHGFWQRVFGGDPGILGRTMILDGEVHSVIGIVPEDWLTPNRASTDLILPLKPSPWWYTNRGSHFLRGLGRLKPEVSLEQAKADFSSIQAALGTEFPETNDGWGAVVRPLKDVMLGSTGSQLLIFLASVGLVLLIACANLANMTLARATLRTRELAIRTAVGAGRGRVVRQLVVESLLLALVGGGLGVLLATFALKSFVTGWPDLLPRMTEIEVNAPVLLFSMGISVLAGMLFGLVPALVVAGRNLAEFLRQGSRSVAGDRSRRWMRSSLVAGEVALALVLLVGTGLLVRSFSALSSENPGFDKENRLVFSTPLPRGRYPNDDQVRTFGGDVLARLEAIPGVESVALTSLIPMRGSDQVWGYWKEANALPGVEEDGSALFYRVSPGYFETIGIPFLAGRDIGPNDEDGQMQVAVVSVSLAEGLFPGENPVGQRIRFGRDSDDPLVEIVGVVGDVQHYHLGQTAMPQIYVPFAQRPTGDVSFVLQTSVPPLDLTGAVREAMESIDPDQPLVGVQPAETLVAESISTPRFRTLLMTGFGITALLLAVIGLYGVMAYSVSQRSREIGVRMALGATRGSVLGLIFREGFPVLGVGLGVGLTGAFALSRILESMLFGVGARDFGVFALVPLILASVATLAMLIPARRATRVDPAKTLGEE